MSSDLLEQYQLYRELHRRQAKESLSKFITYCKDDYDLQWYQELICNKLDALLDGSLGKNKLMIFVPPQHGKSEISSRQFPAYILGKNPGLKIGLCSYAQSLSSSFCMDSQGIIDSEEYQEIFDGTFIGKDVKRTQDYFETVANDGYYKAVGVGGGLTGFTIDIGIVDDPFKDRQEARSETIRNKVWDWYNDVFSTRLHNKSKQLLLFTRWHEDDIAGRLLEREPEEWEVIAIPALKEETKPLIQAVDINDPRKIDEALWEDKHSADRIKKIRETSPVTFSSLYQQRPSAQEGNMILREWFDVLQGYDKMKYRTDIYIDGAYTANTANDPTAIMLVAYNKEEMIVLNSTTVHLELYELLEYFPKYCEANGVEKGRTRVFIEPKASGKSLRSMLQKKGYNAIEIPNKRVALGKISRVEDASPSLQAGKVKLLKGTWNQKLIEECASFPNGAHDDQVDCLTYAVFEYFISPPKVGLKQRN
jgi:predicted phage terminase large subunit-like protein